MVRADIFSHIKPEAGGLIEDLAFMRNGGQYQIKSRLAICGHHHPSPVREIIGIADLACRVVWQALEMGVNQAVVDEFLCVGGHGNRVPKRR